MKLTLFVLSVICVYHVIGHADEDEFHNPNAIWTDEFRAQIRKECREEFLKQFGPQPAEWDPEMDFNVTGCYYACYSQGVGLAKKDGTIYPRTYVAFFRDTHGALNDNKQLELTIKVLEYCNDRLKRSGITDECEAIKMNWNCPSSLNASDLQILKGGEDGGF